MHIANIMLSRTAGGIEQAFVDYCEGLKELGHQVSAITHPKAFINDALRRLRIDLRHLPNSGHWDILAAWRLRQMLKMLAPDVTVAHANRAFLLARKAINDFCPLVGVAHNYNARNRHMTKADGTFVITHDLMRYLDSLGVHKDRMFHIPNMVRCEEPPQLHIRQHPPIIGSMGRFVEKKGFDVMVEALTLLSRKGYTFRAVIGGNGVEEKKLRQLTTKNGMNDTIEFPGWIENKHEFFKAIDIFCLPSLHEPFGIVLLEAFIHGIPAVSTNSEGPSDFITPNYDALMVPMGNPVALADALGRMLDDEGMCQDMSINAFTKARITYSIENVSEMIAKSLQAVITRWRAERMVSTSKTN